MFHIYVHRFHKILIYTHKNNPSYFFDQNNLGQASDPTLPAEHQWPSWWDMGHLRKNWKGKPIIRLQELPVLKTLNMWIDAVLRCLSEAHWNRQCAFQHPQPPGVLSMIANATSGRCGGLFDIKPCSSSWRYTQAFMSWIKTALWVIPWARCCFNCKFREQMKTAPDVFAKRNTVYPAKVGKGCYWWQE